MFASEGAMSLDPERLEAQRIADAGHYESGGETILSMGMD
jgi:hypothetical protein